MKILFIYTDRFAYKIGNSDSGDVIDIVEENEPMHTISDVQTAFIQVENKDQENGNENKLVTKFIKQAKWVARKNNTDRIILHSFAHLAQTKSDPEFAKKIFDMAQERLENAGFKVSQTPFGHFLDLELKAPGKSLARVYYEI